MADPKTIRQQLTETLPTHNSVHPCPPIDAPAEVHTASDDLAAAQERYDRAGAVLDAAEEALHRARAADGAAAEHAALTGKPPAKAAAPKAEQELEDARRVFEAASSQARGAGIALIAAVDSVRDAWLGKLAGDVADRSAEVDRLIVELDRSVRALGFARSTQHEIATAPRPREATVRHGMAGLFPSPRSRQRASSLDQRLVELRADIDLPEGNVGWDERKRAVHATSRRLEALATPEAA